MAKDDLDKLRSIEELHEYQKEVRARIAELNTEYEGLPFPDDARAEYVELTEEDDEIDKRVEELQAREERARKQAEKAGNVEREEVFRPMQNTRETDVYDLSTVRVDPGNPDVATRQFRDRAMRAVEKAYFDHPAVNREDAQERVSKLLDRDQESGELARRILTTGSETYRRAFAKSVVGQSLSSEEQRALSLGTPKAGAGLAVPFQLDPTVIPISNGVVNPMRAISRTETLTATDEWRGLTSTTVQAQYRAEGDEAEDNSPTIAQPSVRVQRADAFVPFSREIGQDWGGILSALATAVQEGKDELEATQFWSGAGTTVFPQGIFTGLSTSQRVAVATNGAFVVNDIYALQGGVPPRHRPTMSFIGSLTNLNRIRAFDTTGTLYVTLDAARPGNLLGKPAYEYSAMPTGLTANAAVLVAGDFSRYLIVDRIGMEVEVIPNLFGGTSRFPTGQRGLFAFWRNSARVLDANAFRYLASTA